MNPLHPKKLLNSKWTKVNVTNKLKHFSITKVSFDEDQNVIECLIRAELNGQEIDINWRELKNTSLWLQGWK
ncbi:TIGR02450 family Trp-rich protein [Shewanella donghaensis]|uniref:TIGR02450 family Trp-rich protein n=1 Tax=Shewanella donghaensis TaxID=238836 RepID=UPI0011843A11|nr:TIGR02450 family Trp-rich protein [Shewanella donghaensis]